MRPIIRGLALCLALSLPTMGSAQGVQTGTPLPEKNAAAADWQVNSTPIVYGGVIFYPTRDFRMFDGHAMTQLGIYEGVPIYTDMSKAPLSAIYVPVSE